MSGSPPLATELRTSMVVRFVPESTLLHSPQSEKKAADLAASYE